MEATRIVGASVWEQELYDHLLAHIEHERETLAAYQRLAEETDSEAFAFLAQMILDDERRHHGLLRALAETIRITSELSNDPTPIPDLGMFRADRDEILAQTERFLALEREDDRELRRLQKELKDVKDTTLWEFVVRLIRHDNAKHREILEFIAARARKPL